MNDIGIDDVQIPRLEGSEAISKQDPSRSAENLNDFNGVIVGVMLVVVQILGYSNLTVIQGIVHFSASKNAASSELTNLFVFSDSYCIIFSAKKQDRTKIKQDLPYSLSLGCGIIMKRMDLNT